jgi:hypothetical protein
LQVETEHRQYLLFTAMGFLHIEHTAKAADMIASVDPAAPLA